MDSTSPRSGAPSSTRKMAVPPLDEETLQTTNPNGASGFTLVTHDGNFVIPPNLPSPSAAVADTPLAIAALLQQHQQQQQQQAAVQQLEQDFMLTRNTLQHCNRYVLLSVITSLLDEYPTQLTLPIKSKLESILISQQRNNVMSVTSPGGRNAPQGAVRGKTNGSYTVTNGTGGTPVWSNTAAANSNVSTPYNNPSPMNRKSRHKNKDDDQEMCSVHHSMRALKHLQRNPATGLYECVHGFHCLVDGPAETSALDHSQRSSHNTSHAYSNGGNPYDNELSSPPPMAKLSAAPAAPVSQDLEDDDGKMDIQRLETLLKSVRDMQTDN